MKRILFFTVFLVANIYPMATNVDKFEGDASRLITDLTTYKTYLPEFGTFEVYVKHSKMPLMKRILTATKNKNNELLDFICKDPVLAQRVTKITFKTGLSITIPPCIENLVNLKSLILDGVVLQISTDKGRIPAEISNLKNLQTLDLRRIPFPDYEQMYIKRLFENQNVKIMFGY